MHWTAFQEWVLDVLERIPRTNLEIPDFVYNFLKDFVSIVDCFVVYADFVPILSASIFLSVMTVSITLLHYVRGFRGVK